MKITIKKSGLTAGKQYAAQVRALGNDTTTTDSPWSLRLDFTTDKDLTPPGPVTDLTLNVQNADWSARWTKPVFDAEGEVLEDLKDYKLVFYEQGTDPTVSNHFIAYTSSTNYLFTYSQNVQTFGVPTKAISVDVYARDFGHNESTPVTDSDTNGAPGAFVLTPAESQQPLEAAMHWTKPTGGDLDRFVVHRGTATGVYNTTFNLGDTYQFIDIPTVRDTYFYKVTAYDVYGNATDSNEVQIRVAGFWEAEQATPDDVTLNTGAVVTGSPVSEISSADGSRAYLEFDWTGPTTQTTDQPGDGPEYTYGTDGVHNYYEVRWREVGSSSYNQTISNQDQQDESIRIDGLLAGEDYEYGVRAVNRYGHKSAWATDTITLAADTTPPSKPQNLTASGGIRTITVRWDSVPETDLDFYALARHTSATDVFANGDVIYTGNGTGYADSVGGEETWYYAVRAYDTSGNVSPDSDTDSATSLGDPDYVDVDPPADVTGLDATVSTYYHGSTERGRVALSWNAIGDADLYIISVKEDSGAWEETVVGGGQTGHTLNSLTMGSVYQFRMKAQDSSGNRSSVWSTTVQRTVTSDSTALPATVTGLAATNTTRGVVFKWDASSSAKHNDYLLETASNAGFTTNLRTRYVDGNEFTLAVSSGTTYYARVKARDIYGNLSAAYSATASGSATALVAADIASNAITSAKILNGSVALEKFGTNLRPVQVVSSLPTLPSSIYPMGSVVSLTTDGKLYRNQSNVWTASVPTNDLSGQITETQISDDAITTPKIAANAITAGEIAADAITSDKIVANAITSAKILAGAIGTDQLAANSVVAAKIAAGEIDTDHINVIDLSADSIFTGTLNATRITIGAGSNFDANYDPSTKETPAGAQSKADAAQSAAIASAEQYTDQETAGLITTFYQDTEPTTAESDAGDLWVDTNDGNLLYRFDGTSYVAVRDAGIQVAIDTATSAEETADGKTLTFFQAIQPVLGDLPAGVANFTVGDLWFDTDDERHPYRYNGTSWVSIRDQYIDTAAQAAQSNAVQQSAAYTDGATDGLITSYYQATKPVQGQEGDLWIDTDDGNLLYRYDASIPDYVPVQDGGIQQSIQGYQNAQATADGKILSFFQATQPVSGDLPPGVVEFAVGDLWFDTSNDQKPYRYNGSTWTAVGGYAEAQATAAQTAAEQTANDIDAALRGDFTGSTTGTQITTSGIATNAITTDLLESNIAIINGLRVQSLFEMNAAGSMESSNFVAGTSGFRLDIDSLEIYGDGLGGGTSLIIGGASGLNMNSDSGELWFNGATLSAASWYVNNLGDMRVGGSGKFYVEGATGDVWSGNATKSLAPWNITGDGLATFKNVRIIADSNTPDGTTVLDVGGEFLVTKVTDTEAEVRLAGNLFIDAGGSIDVSGGDITLTTGGVEVGASGYVRSNNYASSGFNLAADGTITVGGTTSPKFTVGADGAITATGATIVGDITANGGSIEGLLQIGAAGQIVLLGSNGAISGGNLTGAGIEISDNGIAGYNASHDMTFEVTENGVLFASGASISGVFTVTGNSTLSGNLAVIGGGIAVGSTAGTAAAGSIKIAGGGSLFVESGGDIYLTGGGIKLGDTNAARDAAIEVAIPGNPGIVFGKNVLDYTSPWDGITFDVLLGNNIWVRNSSTGEIVFRVGSKLGGSGNYLEYGSNNGRVEIKTDEFSVIGGNATFSGEVSGALITGTTITGGVIESANFRTGTSGDRIEIYDDPGNPAEIKIWDGSDKMSIGRSGVNFGIVCLTKDLGIVTSRLNLNGELYNQGPKLYLNYIDSYLESDLDSGGSNFVIDADSDGSFITLRSDVLSTNTQILFGKQTFNTNSDYILFDDPGNQFQFAADGSVDSSIIRAGKIDLSGPTRSSRISGFEGMLVAGSWTYRPTPASKELVLASDAEILFSLGDPFDGSFQGGLRVTRRGSGSLRHTGLQLFEKNSNDGMLKFLEDTPAIQGRNGADTGWCTVRAILTDESDVVLKTNFARMTDHWVVISNMDAWKYEWDDGRMSSGRRAGVVAQELPDYMTEVDNYGSLGVSPMAMVATLLAAVKDLKREVAELKGETIEWESTKRLKREIRDRLEGNETRYFGEKYSGEYDEKNDNKLMQAKQKIGIRR